MKYLSILFFGIIFSLNIQAQEAEKTKKTVETTIAVKGVCNMCKNRIEEAAMRVNGVKFANWDKKTQELTVVYKSKKASETDIHKAVAAKGHETVMVEADSVAYKKLPGCCLYKDGAKCSN